jgi:hypothetical protein
MYYSPNANVSWLPDDVLTLLYYSAMYSARVSEMLRIMSADHLPEDRYIVRGLKRSASYVVMIPSQLVTAPVGWFEKGTGGIFRLDYATVFRWCQRVGIGFTPAGHKAVARTHAHRYQTAKAVSDIADCSAATAALHHRSGRSVDFYINPRGGSHG